ncbi:MAG: hypothetical protein HYY96_02290 [Candidatus Tectomicrobia bacterium]|nr:hypothetical protein [Candidatus Tectomicrobia bacterium]
MRARLTTASNAEVRAFLNKVGELELTERLVFTFGGFQFSQPIANRQDAAGSVVITDDKGRNYTFQLID